MQSCLQWRARKELSRIKERDARTLTAPGTAWLRTCHITSCWSSVRQQAMAKMYSRNLCSQC